MVASGGGVGQGHLVGGCGKNKPLGVSQAQGCIHCTTWGTEPMIGTNCKWRVTFKNCIQNKNYF